MTHSIDSTHDLALQSWVEDAQRPDTDFPLQNLPFGQFLRARGESPRIGVAIGDHVLDVVAAGLTDVADINTLMQWPKPQQRALRHALSEGLAVGSAHRSRLARALYKQTEIEMLLPCKIGDYTDFYTSLEHATAVGKLFRPDNPLFPNYKWVPIGYHGRASSIIVSGRDFHRPTGQTRPDPVNPPVLGPSQKLDFELELGIVIGAKSTLGRPIPIDRACEHVFGVTLLNDWSARDIQAWEYQPLGPFLGKNFASTLSPWIVTLEALAPFRTAFRRAESDPAPLPYLDHAGERAHGALDIQLEVHLQTAQMKKSGDAPVRLTRSNYAQAYWTFAQLVTHHTINGCNLQSGDLFGTGTLSGVLPEEAGSMLELTQGGAVPLTLPNGQTRGFLEDGDTVWIKAYCERAGFRRIGFGDCFATILGSQRGA